MHGFPPSSTTIKSFPWFGSSHNTDSPKLFLCRFAVFTKTALEVIDSLSKHDYDNFRKFLKTLSPSDLEWTHLREDTLLKVNKARKGLLVA
jgi:hypothetical protein